jgi:hypothetical protein
VDRVLDGEPVARPLHDVTEPSEGRNAHDLTLFFGYQNRLVFIQPSQDAVCSLRYIGLLDRRRGKVRVQERHNRNGICGSGGPDDHPEILAEPVLLD